jgi:DNA-binding NtrC family response regulator
MKILIVDDNSKDIERLCKWLTGEGAQVEICRSGAEAEKVMAVEGDSFDIAFILWDVAGVPNGLELLVRFRQNFPKLQSVLTSYSLNADITTVAYRLGVRDFLEKPFNAKRIIDCLHSLTTIRRPELPLIGELRRRIMGESRKLSKILHDAACVIPRTDRRVLLLGETGTGKELIAKAIHQLGAFPHLPFVAVNLASIPATLLESALFGHERWAFTDARETRIGCLEEAGEGTLFLDEVGEMNPAAQAKLLRVLQEKSFRRLGSTADRHFKARLICATNVDLIMAVKEGKFRRDLFFRIAQVTIHVPPLRERDGDVPILLQHFLDLYRGNREISFARETLSILNSYRYSGNVRELENIVSEALIRCDEDEIRPKDIDLETLTALHDPVEPPIELVEVAPATVKPSTPAANRQLEDQLIFLEDWLKLPYREAQEKVIDAFDCIYFPRKYEKNNFVKTRAADDAQLDRKTFDQRLAKAMRLRRSIGRTPQDDEEE